MKSREKSGLISVPGTRNGEFILSTPPLLAEEECMGRIKLMLENIMVTLISNTDKENCSFFRMFA